MSYTFTESLKCPSILKGVQGELLPKVLLGASKHKFCMNPSPPPTTTPKRGKYYLIILTNYLVKAIKERNV